MEPKSHNTIPSRNPPLDGGWQGCRVARGGGTPGASEDVTDDQNGEIGPRTPLIAHAPPKREGARVEHHPHLARALWGEVQKGW